MSSLSATRSYRVLIIDDSNNIHEDFKKVLSRPNDMGVSALEAELFGDAETVEDTSSWFVVDSAFQGDEGIAMVTKAKDEKDPYALAFVDMRMPPGLDGLGTIVKLWEVDPQLQVVICSAYSDYSWTEIIARLGRSDRLVILRKPFDNIEVLQLTHALTEKWNLHQQVESHVNKLESLVSKRTQELHTSQSLFRLILENTHDVILVIDASGRRIYSSPARERLLGLIDNEMSDVPFWSMIHPDEAEEVKEAAARVFASGQRETITMRCRHREGHYLHFEASLNSVNDDDGKSLYLVIAARDITERYKIELQTRLNQKLESIGLLAAGVAHEINTPTQFISDNVRFLTEGFGKLDQIIKGYRDLLKQVDAAGQLSAEMAAIRRLEKECELEYYQGEVPRTLEQSLAGLGRVARIVRSLKEFSHPGSPTLAPVDLNHAIDNAIEVCRHEWKYVADVVTEFDPTLPLVPCLADELNQAVLNLLINAGHAIGDARVPGSEARGTITVKTQHSEGWAVISITDTGVGIPEGIHDRVFEPFFTTKALGKGTGQGLPIVRSVVVGKHQGKVSFTSQVGKGATFIIHLPLAGPISKVNPEAAA